MTNLEKLIEEFEEEGGYGCCSGDTPEGHAFYKNWLTKAYKLGRDDFISDLSATTANIFRPRYESAEPKELTKFKCIKCNYIATALYGRKAKCANCREWMEPVAK